MRERVVELLLVEDNAGDVELVKEALKGVAFRVRLSVVKDGEEALAYLRRQGTHSKVSRPHLILLDLNLPRKDGYEVLREIKKDSRLKRIPVIVLSCSAAEKDVLESYDLQANSYVTKAADFEGIIKILNSIGGFWLEVATLPPN